MTHLPAGLSGPHQTSGQATVTKKQHLPLDTKQPAPKKEGTQAKDIACRLMIAFCCVVQGISMQLPSLHKMGSAQKESGRLA